MSVKEQVLTLYLITADPGEMVGQIYGLLQDKGVEGSCLSEGIRTHLYVII